MSMQYYWKYHHNIYLFIYSRSLAQLHMLHVIESKDNKRFANGFDADRDKISFFSNQDSKFRAEICIKCVIFFYKFRNFCFAKT